MWRKIFKDKPCIEEPESWSNTPTMNMSGVELDFAGFLLGIYGEGEYWQSDTYEKTILPNSSGEGILVCRRVQKLVDKKTTVYISHYKNADKRETWFVRCDPSLPPEEAEILVFDDKNPSWFTVEISAREHSIRWYLSKDRI